VEVKTREEILRELIAKAEEHPGGWKAATRRDEQSFGQEYLIFHPKAGIYEVKEYQVNPFEVSGVGAQLAPSVPAGLPRLLQEQTGVFGILEVSLPRLLEELGEAPEDSVTPLGLSGDLGVRVPMTGPTHRAPSSLESLDSSLNARRRVVDAEFRKLLDRGGITRAYA
jgi:hypothetical protein